MARRQPDFVIEAVHYTSDGSIAWVRGYERRGKAYSDLIKLSREALIQRLRAGQRMVIGRRKPYWGHTFEGANVVRLVEQNGQPRIVAGNAATGKDHLPAPQL